MAYVITEPCIGTKDNSCVEVCPVDCIHPTPDEPDYDKVEMLYIDPEECIDCDACVEACPVDACFAEDQVPDEWAEVHPDERGLLQEQPSAPARVADEEGDLDAVVDLELVQQAGDVGLDGRHAQVQPLRDGRVGVTLADGERHLQLARAERLQPLLRAVVG